MKTTFFKRALAAWVLAGACCAANANATADNAVAQLNAVLWTQQSIEHQAATLTVYRAAIAALPMALKRKGWASLEQGPARSRRPAIVMDLDETVLDNSAYSAWGIKEDKPYNEDDWQNWMALEQELALPGALAFVRAAQRRGADVFYVSNRECRPTPADACPARTHTMARLTALGFPRAGNLGAYLFKNQEPEWGSSDKSSRRTRVAQTHRIAMLFGDDMRDFLPTASVERLRSGQPDAPASKLMDLLGTRWFVVPNPMYGSWERAVPNNVPGKVDVLKAPPPWQH